MSAESNVPEERRKRVIDQLRRQMPGTRVTELATGDAQIEWFEESSGDYRGGQFLVHVARADIDKFLIRWGFDAEPLNEVLWGQVWWNFEIDRLEFFARFEPDEGPFHLGPDGFWSESRPTSFLRDLDDVSGTTATAFRPDENEPTT